MYYIADNYQEAVALLQMLARKKDSSLVKWDAGDGYQAEGQYCPHRKRVVTSTISPTGVRIW